jgi:hypothetical protein
MNKASGDIFEKRKTTMTKKWIAMNLLFLAIAGLLGRYVFKSIEDIKQKNKAENITPKPTATASDNRVLPLPESPRTYNRAEFSVITEKTLFVEDRTNVIAKPAIVETPVPEIAPLAPRPILIGTSISDNNQSALIVDPVGAPGSVPGVSRRAQVKRIGDSYQGYAITQIAAENIVLEAGTRKETISLHEGSKRPKGGKTAIQATRVVSIGGGNNGVTTGASPVVASADAALIAMIPSNVQQNPAEPRIVAAATPLPGTVQPQTGQPFNYVGPTPDGRGRIIRTPFMDIVLPN